MILLDNYDILMLTSLFITNFFYDHIKMYLYWFQIEKLYFKEIVPIKGDKMF